MHHNIRLHHQMNPLEVIAELLELRRSQQRRRVMPKMMKKIRCKEHLLPPLLRKSQILNGKMSLDLRLRKRVLKKLLLCQLSFLNFLRVRDSLGLVYCFMDHQEQVNPSSQKHVLQSVIVLSSVSHHPIWLVNGRENPNVL